MDKANDKLKIYNYKGKNWIKVKDLSIFLSCDNTKMGYLIKRNNHNTITVSKSVEEEKKIFFGTTNGKVPRFNIMTVQETRIFIKNIFPDKINNLNAAIDEFAGLKDSDVKITGIYDVSKDYDNDLIKITDEYNLLKAKYELLDEKYKEMTNEYNSLSDSLSSKYNSLEDKYNLLGEECGELNSVNISLNLRNSTLDAEVKVLKSLNEKFESIIRDNLRIDNDNYKKIIITKVKQSISSIFDNDDIAIIKNSIENMNNDETQYKICGGL